MEFDAPWTVSGREFSAISSALNLCARLFLGQAAEIASMALVTPRNIRVTIAARQASRLRGIGSLHSRISSWLGGFAGFNSDDQLTTDFRGLHSLTEGFLRPDIMEPHGGKESAK